MKKQFFRWVAAALTVLLLAGCAPGEASGNHTNSYIRPAVGQVHMYTCDEALLQKLQPLAEEYTARTGIQVRITLAAGRDCGPSLDAALDSGDPPTVFCLHSREDLVKRTDILKDLSGTDLAAQLVSEGFGLGSGDRLLALAADVQSYGLIYNASLLARAGFTRSDILSFEDLEMICGYITDKSLGFSAFAPWDLSDPGHRGVGCLLAGTMGNADQLKRFWDLYLRNGAGAGVALSAFAEGSSVFCVGGTWDYAAVAGLGDSSLDILPAYTPAGGSMQYAVELAWGINGSVPKEDVERSMEFLTWLVTRGERDAAPVDELGLFAPFREAAGYENQLEKKVRAYMASEIASVSWECCESWSKESLERLSLALAAYSGEPTEENWNAVKDLFG